MALATKIGRARVEQINRVNGDKTVFESVADLEQKVTRLQELLQAEKVKVAERDDLISTLREQLASPASGDRHNGRSVITCAEAAVRAGVSIYTVSRYLNSGHWEGARLANGRWWVYADKPLPVKRGK